EKYFKNCHLLLAPLYICIVLFKMTGLISRNKKMCAALDSTRERTHLSLFIYSLFNNPFLPRMRLSFCFSFFRKRLSIQTTSLIQLKFILHYRRMTCKDFIIEESGGMEYERKAYPRDNPFGAGKAGPQHGQ